MTTKKIVRSKKSKKVTTHKKMKIARKIKKAKTKMRREVSKMKKLGTIHKRRQKKQLIIPNSFPFKKILLLRMKQKEEQENLAQLEKMKLCQQQDKADKEQKALEEKNEEINN